MTASVRRSVRAVAHARSICGMEARHGIELLDWSSLGSRATESSPGLSLDHARAALRPLDGSDGFRGTGAPGLHELAEARGQLLVRVFVAARSLSSPSARHDQPQEWPANFKVGLAEPSTMRDMYAHSTVRDTYEQASVVVEPLVPNDFGAGITVILEAMAMAVVVIATGGMLTWSSTT